MIRITIDGDKAIKQIENLIKGLDYSKPFKEAKKILHDEINNNFDQQGAIYQGGGFIRSGGAFSNLGPATTRGRAWKPLAPRTVADRIRKGFPGKRPILIRTGRLKAGFRLKSDENSVEAENAVEYAPIHQNGSGWVPQRRILDLSEKFVAVLERLLINFANDTIKKNGLSS